MWPPAAVKPHSVKVTALTKLLLLCQSGAPLNWGYLYTCAQYDSDDCPLLDWQQQTEKGASYQPSSDVSLWLCRTVKLWIHKRNKGWLNLSVLLTSVFPGRDTRQGRMTSPWSPLTAWPFTPATWAREKNNRLLLFGQVSVVSFFHYLPLKSSTCRRFKDLHIRGEVFFPFLFIFKVFTA